MIEFQDKTQKEILAQIRAWAGKFEDSDIEIEIENYNRILTPEELKTFKLE